MAISMWRFDAGPPTISAKSCGTADVAYAQGRQIVHLGIDEYLETSNLIAKD